MQPLEALRRHDDALRRETAFDQRARAGADHVARLREGQRRAVLKRQRMIEGADQIGCGVDEGPVEIEDDGAGGGRHGAAS